MAFKMFAWLSTECPGQVYVATQDCRDPRQQKFIPFDTFIADSIEGLSGDRQKACRAEWADKLEQAAQKIRALG